MGFHQIVGLVTVILLPLMAITTAYGLRTTHPHVRENLDSTPARVGSYVAIVGVAAFLLSSLGMATFFVGSFGPSTVYRLLAISILVTPLAAALTLVAIGATYYASRTADNLPDDVAVAFQVGLTGPVVGLAFFVLLFVTQP